MVTTMNKNGYSMAWAPAPNRQIPTPFTTKSTSLGQKGTVLDSKEISLVTDALVTTGAAYIAWGMTEKYPRSATFWWVVAGITFVKGLHDLSRPY
jgi:hypothetical protein